MVRGKKILFVITKSNWGGAQAYVYALAVHLQKNGAMVTVAFGGTGRPGAETGLLALRLREAGMAIEVLSSFARDVSLPQELCAFKELRAVIQRLRPDIVHLNSSKAGGLGALAARTTGVQKIIYTAHGWAHRESRNSLKKLFVRFASWITIVLSHTVIVVSGLDYRDAPVLFSRKKLVVVRNGSAPFPLLSKKEAREALTKNAPIPLEATWLITQAELHPNKGIAVAITALQKIISTHPNTYLVVVGEGEERAALEELASTLSISDHVFLIGFVTDSRTYLRAADIFLMPSYKEGLPIALLEAGFASLPVIASNTGGIPEVIEDEKNALLVAPGSTSELAAAIESLLNDAEKAQHFGKALHACVLKSFSEERMFEETLSVYLQK